MLTRQKMKERRKNTVKKMFFMIIPQPETASWSFSGSCKTQGKKIQINLLTLVDKESNFDVASSRNLAQELVFHNQRASGSFQAFANIAFLSSTVLTVLARSCSPVQQSGVGFGALPVAKPRQAAAFELTVLHGTAAPFMLARQKRKESRKSMEKKRFFMAI
ncbi:hypothetical protein Peur_000159 [Populus x canadensis]